MHTEELPTLQDCIDSLSALAKLPPDDRSVVETRAAILDRIRAFFSEDTSVPIEVKKTPPKPRPGEYQVWMWKGAPILLVREITDTILRAVYLTNDIVSPGVLSGVDNIFEDISEDSKGEWQYFGCLDEWIKAQK